MNNEKLENLLNLSLDASPEERERSEILSVGYNKTFTTWELIVKYNGSLSPLSYSEIIIEPLLCSYAIVTIPENLIEEFSMQPSITYIEKPKQFYFENRNPLISSCIFPSSQTGTSLSGKGVIVAILDSGIDYTLLDFRNLDGTTRILSLWDQTISPHTNENFSSPKGFSTGTEFTEATINSALFAPTKAEQLAIVPSVDLSGHGTAVAQIAVGNGTTNSNFKGVAPMSQLLIVKIGTSTPNGFPKTTQLMRGLSYVASYALSRNKPLVINLSFGNTYGSHDGTSLLERYLDNISELGRTSICVGSGNEASSGGHASGQLKNGEITQELSISPYTTNLNIQLWKHYVDSFDLNITTPSGSDFFVPIDGIKTIRFREATCELLIYVGMPVPYSVRQEIFIDFLPEEAYLPSGIWRFIIVPKTITIGSYDYYLPSSSVRNSSTKFFIPDDNKTLTIPSTSHKVITVGAYDTTYDSYAFFSGRGSIHETPTKKPDLVAPGVNIQVPSSATTFSSYQGTSYATPFVSGSCALLLEWGILLENDPYLYGEKLKAYLQKGARELRPFTEFPNAQVGYGALCLQKSYNSFFM